MRKQCEWTPLSAVVFSFLDRSMQTYNIRGYSSPRLFRRRVISLFFHKACLHSLVGGTLAEILLSVRGATAALSYSSCSRFLDAYGGSHKAQTEFFRHTRSVAFLSLVVDSSA